MCMPKTTMYKDRDTAPRKHNIGTPWKGPYVEPVAIPRSVKRGPDHHFRFCVAAAKRSHHFATDGPNISKRCPRHSPSHTLRSALDPGLPGVLIMQPCLRAM